MKKRIIAETVKEPPPGSWSNCYVVDNQVILAGQVARDEEGNLVGGSDPYEQAMQAFRNMKALVEAAGARMSDVVKINVYLTDIEFRPAFLKARRQFFFDPFPAAVVVGNVTLASPDLLVEIDAWAFMGAGGD